jgi:ribokinase
MTSVVVVGSANIDLIARVEHLPAPGETLLGSEVTVRPGGKGANQAVAAARLGADTTIFAAIGRDSFGDQVRAALADQGVRQEQVIGREDAPTGLAMVTVCATGENSIVVAPGANHLLDTAALAALPSLMHSGDVLVLQMEVPLDTCLAAARVGQEHGALVVLNAAPLPTVDDPAFLALLGSVDVLILNEGEAAALSGCEPASDWAVVADGLRGLGPSTVVITLGADGAVAADGTGSFAQKPFPVDVVDTTGAGDAFCGALAAAYAQSRPLPEALRRGCAAGALATTRLGAQSALPTTTDLDELLAEVS